MSSSIAKKVVRTAGIFQLVVALPIALIMGEWVIEQFFYPYNSFYDSVTAICTFLMAASIIFIVFVQRHPAPPPTLIWYLEIAKSILATGLWLWLILDALFGPNRWYGRSKPEWRKQRAGKAAVCIMLLFVLFYPTLVYTLLNEEGRDRTPDEEREDSGANGERAPLLQT